MKTEASGIFSRSMSAGRKIGQKVRVRKWLDTPDFAAYEQFISDWHYMTKELGERIRSLGAEGQEKSKNLSLCAEPVLHGAVWRNKKGFMRNFTGG